MALLSDNNADLINCYLQVRDHPEDVIRHLSRLRNTEDAYYETRSRTPRCDAAKAARIIYLTTLAFNGIYRVNLRGEFNVPYGHKAHLKPFDPESIEAASRALLSARFRCADFEAATAAAMCGDFVYFDPPYTVAHGNNGFLKYNSRIFSWEDQVRLGEVAARLARRGCKVVVSNADHPSIMRLYKGFRVKRVERTSRIAASAAFRRRVSECIFHSGG
jgi:DNA adenine methylase